MSTPERAAPKEVGRKGQRTRLAVAGGVGALATVFAVLNLDEVDVNWLFGTWSTPLIVVIVLCVAAGMAIDRALVRRARKPSRRRSSAP